MEGFKNNGSMSLNEGVKILWGSVSIWAEVSSLSVTESIVIFIKRIHDSGPSHRSTTEVNSRKVQKK